MPQRQPDHAGPRILLARGVAIAAAEAGRPRRFTLEAYTGEPMRLRGFDSDVVLDLDKIDLTIQRIPALYDHMPHEECVVGQVESLSVTGGALVATGIFTPTGEPGDYAAKVLARADAGYQWQASVGADADQYDRYREGETAAANGREYPGPVIVARGVRVREVSFVVLGADSRTSAMVAHERGGLDIMATFSEWLANLGVDDESILPDALKEMLQKIYDEENREETDQPPGNSEPEAKVAARRAVINASGNMDIIADIRKKAAAELSRIGKIRELAAGNEGIAAKAISEGWDETRTELELLRASRVTANKYVTTNSWRSAAADIRCHEAAVLMAGGYPTTKLEKEYSDQTLQAAHDLYKGRIGLQQLVRNLAIQGGYVGDPEVKSNIRPMIQAIFSTADIGGILSNIANKFLLEGYSHVDQSWKAIAATRSVPDFKQVTSYRLSAESKFEKVGPTGELKHGALGEQSYTNKADTYGLLMSISWHDIQNDDLDALSKTPAQIGRGAALALNEVFWSEFLAEHTTGRSLFPTDKSKRNYIDGAVESAVSVTGLSKAVETFRNQVDTNGNPLGLTPRIWVVPVKYETLALQIMASTEVREKGSSDKTYATANPFTNRFTVVSSPYLSNPRMGGAHSTESWYLLADPAELPFIEVAFLNGVQQPTVEQADADFSKLGIQMRGYFSFGVRTQDYRAAVKAKNAA